MALRRVFVCGHLIAWTPALRCTALQVRATLAKANVDAAAKAAVKLKMLGARIHSRKRPSDAPGRDGDAESAEHLHHRAVGRTGRARVQTEMPAARSLKRSLTGALGAFGSGKVKVDDTANA